MSEEKESFIKRYFIALIGSLGLIAIAVTTYIVLPFTCLVWYTSQCHVISEQFGQVGDLFGGIANPIITFLALIALLYSIKIQKEELKKTSEALKQQNDYIAKQNFENTFFQMLNEWNTSINNASLTRDNQNHAFRSHDNPKNTDPIKDSTTKKGRKIFEILLENDLKINKKYNEPEYDDIFKSFWIKNRSFLSPHMLFLLEILRFVDSRDIEEAQKKNYTAIVSAQITTHERIFIFYFCLCKTHGQTLKSLIEKYAFFEYLDTDILLNNVYRLNFRREDTGVAKELIQTYFLEYSKKAFGDNKGAIDIYNYTPKEAS